MIADNTALPVNGFAALGVPAPLVRVLADQGKTEPFPIQTGTLPDTLAGRDVLGRGKTGSGKTLAFALPMVAQLAKLTRARAGRPTGLILAPTRELATQIAEVVAPLAAAYQLKHTTVFGGVKQQRQVNALKSGVDIVVACPGRLEDLIKQGFVSLSDIEITVLDEADHMADLGFLPGVTRLLSQTPAGGQRLLFSATLDNGVNKLVERFLHKPVTHSVDSANSPVSAMTHHVFAVNSDEKRDVVAALASGTQRRILFTRTKHQAKKLAKQLTNQGIPAVDLHGNLSQNARDRNLASFGEGKVNVLVATDVAARGVHVDGIELVVHVDPPMEHKAYLHRSGRTARAGAAGDVVTLMLPEQRGDTVALLRKAAIKAAPVPVSAKDPKVVALIGEVAPYVKPAPAQSAGQNPAKPGKSQGANAQRKRARRAGAQATGNLPASSTKPGASGNPGSGKRSATGKPASAGRSVGGRSAGGRSVEGRSTGANSAGGRSSGGSRQGARQGNRRRSDAGHSARTR